MGNAASNQGLIIGLTVGAVVLLIIIIITVVCCCCRKAERSILKRGVRRLERQTEEQKNQLKIQQSERRTELNKKHDEIREKYGLRNSAAATSSANPNDNIFSVENDKVTLSIK